ncbi:uridine phosphorylase 1-like isoform X2 [Tachypleus tridentatus]|uniref:uridine phosphorylase 1-like isoform X2 n=1 Tax=Tachypleus tridentatus TaxID=6853 RepID=UPI003FD269B9
MDFMCRNQEGRVVLKNPHIHFLEEDILYHLSFSTRTHNFLEMFGDVKFVCVGGTAKRMEGLAYLIGQKIGVKLPTGAVLQDISSQGQRYAMYKVGPVLTVSHGMGVPSLSILLHEVIKLLYHAKCKDVTFIRIGTCGGIGIEPGTTVISETVVDGLLRPYLEMPVLGQIIRRPAKLDQLLVEELKSIAEEQLPQFPLVVGKTLCTHDFYEGQGRLDGAFCCYTEREKEDYLHHLQDVGVINIEMESLAFASVCNYCNLRGAVMCVSIIDRLQGDQIQANKATLEEWQRRPQEVAATFIKSRLAES